MADTDEAIDVIYRELSRFARRARSRSARLHPDLSFVAYTLLSHIHKTGGCRATDLATHYLLDKSTVSRQIAALEAAGLVERVFDPDDHRVQTLRVTPAGRAKIEAAHQTLKGALRERLDGWDGEALRQLADHLVRFNAEA